MPEGERFRKVKEVYKNRFRKVEEVYKNGQVSNILVER